MRIAPEKREKVVSMFGEERVAAFEAKGDELVKSARDQGLESKDRPAPNIVPSILKAGGKAGRPSIAVAVQALIDDLEGSGLNQLPEGVRILEKLRMMLQDARALDGLKEAGTGQGQPPPSFAGPFIAALTEHPAAPSDKSTPEPVFSPIDVGFAASVGGPQAVKGLVNSRPVVTVRDWMGYLLTR